MILKIFIFIIVTIVSVKSSDEFSGIFSEGEISTQNKYNMNIVPGYAPHKQQLRNKIQLSDVIDENNEHYKLFMHYVEKGYAKKGLIFNIYDDRMRSAAISLFRALEGINCTKDFQTVKEWADENINTDLFEYVWRLASLYYNYNDNKETIPPFLMKPNYFINSETIIKALHLKINNGHFHRDVAKINQFYRTNNLISINTNYSEWNLNLNDVKFPKYFMEDIALNSYYYGQHLLYPFWMSNREMIKLNSKYAEHFYFVRCQLLARYYLEKGEEGRRDNYNPYLVYDNGLPLDTKLNKGEKEWNSHFTTEELIERELVLINLQARGSYINITEENYVDLLTKFIRVNYDSVITPKISRGIYGDVQDPDEYNPAPSLLHHAETSLRHPAYWTRMKLILQYYSSYESIYLPHFDLSKYETENYQLLDFDYSNIITYFEYYQFNINKALNDDIDTPLVFAARQRRLNHQPFKMNFTIKSMKNDKAIIRIFIGPQNTDLNFKFFQLDAYQIQLNEGVQIISWPNETSNSVSYDDYFNLEKPLIMENLYNVFKFPKNLLIPAGNEEGLNLTLFVIVTPIDFEIFEETETNYNRYVYAVDKKPLRFPFHRPAVYFNQSAYNYKFYNIIIYHKRMPLDDSGYFSPDLY